MSSEWSRESIITAIQERRRRGLPLTGVWRENLELYRSAEELFGGWHLALAAAGLRPRLAHYWSRELIVDVIQCRQQHGPPLNLIWKENRPLLRAGVNYFGNWHSALAAAGLETRPVRRWSKERIIDELRACFRSGPVRICKVNPQLYRAAQYRFGTTDHALEVAGLDPEPWRWPKRRIVAIIQDRYVRGEPIQFVGFRDKRLAENAKRHFGTWRAAVAAAGLESRLPAPAPRRRWSKPAILDAMQHLFQQGIGPSKVWKHDPKLYSSAKVHFGSWQNAVQAAGEKSTRRAWTPQLVIQLLKTRYAQGLSCVSSHVFREDCGLGAAAMRTFGNWHAALQAAGIRLPQSHPASRRRQVNGICAADHLQPNFQYRAQQ